MGSSSSAGAVDVRSGSGGGEVGAGFGVSAGSVGVGAASAVDVSFVAAVCAAFLRCTLLGGRGAAVSPRSTSRRSWIATSSSIGAFSGCCPMAALSCLAASRMRSAGVNYGIVMVWCLNQ